ncbi:MAG TPA: glycosyltransferase family 4 protein [Thermoplasmata archaeon]|jgi:glycosyltransferase involved in cell wall biosynthesis|nr:glycosyltransferase family 4 protein [Thermoplasmata archaeon]
MTRVLMLVSNPASHDPRVAAEAQSLAKAGYEVTILGWDRSGKEAPEETQDGVRTVRVRSSLGMRLMLYDIFRLPSFWRRALRRALELHQGTPFSIVHAHDLDTLPIGVQFKRRAGAKLVYDAHEIFPYLVEQSRAARFAPRFERLERGLVPEADLVIAAGIAHKEYLSPIARGPIALVTNSKPLLFASYEPPANPRMTVAYLGGLDPTRLLLPLAELAVEDGTFDAVIAGDGPLAGPIEELAARSSGRLRYLGVVPMVQIMPLTRGADLVFSVFDPSKRLNKIGVPNKFFEALVAGRPVIASRGTWVGEEIESADCGVAIEYTKAALRDALLELVDDPQRRERLGRNAFRLAQEKYNWAHEEAILLRAYADVMRP